MKNIPQELIGLKLKSRINCFLKEHSIGTLLPQCNFNKQAGFSNLLTLKVIFSLVFSGKNQFQTLQNQNSLLGLPKKDTIYRMLNSCRYNWGKLLLLLGSQIVKEKLAPLTSEDRENFLIIDNSIFSRNRSKKVELLARVRDNASGKYIKGFRMLTLG